MPRRYTYGPVASRRLGRSLGVDLVPAKTCSFNCVYCQLGPTLATTVQRAEYNPVAEVLAEVQARLVEGPRPDYVTLGGSGEPTLHSSFGAVARGIGRFSDVPIALLTNGSLFHLREVRWDCEGLDLVLPSLDAGDEETFRRVNRPHPGITLANVIEGLEALRGEFRGQIWLEVFLVEGVNSSDEQVRAIRNCIERIAPDRVQLNTAVRPPAEPQVRPVSPEMLEEVRRMLGPRAEVIVGGGAWAGVPGAEAAREEVLALLRRRPCTVQDLADGLGIPLAEAARCVRALLDEGAIVQRQRHNRTYYEALRDQEENEK
ncbi:MAG: radical SAM protein [Planctomycetota bacterium]